MHDIKFSGYSVFFDFDNTITAIDILDDIIERFSENRDWEAYEKSWKAGRIGSRECLKGQLKSVRITKKGLLRYLSMVKIDPYFKKVLAALKERKIKPVILSDNFSFIIKNILKNNDITGLTVYSNSLRFRKDRIIPSFPHALPSCLRCGNCKKSSLSKNNFRDKIIYIGDGLSDVCAAKEADIVFGKDSLLEHFRKIKKDCIPFKDLRQVYNYFNGD